ncbi:hypothetical protein B0H13DRAFT_1854001 [Mycena leptocephala]|nr:hypothetical protein B0H13DRAFT_1854001 [Mycena leptocephala]
MYNSPPKASVQKTNADLATKSFAAKSPSEDASKSGNCRPGAIECAQCSLRVVGVNPNTTRLGEARKGIHQYRVGPADEYTTSIGGGGGPRGVHTTSACKERAREQGHEQEQERYSPAHIGRIPSLQQRVLLPIRRRRKFRAATGGYSSLGAGAAYAAVMGGDAYHVGSGPSGRDGARF